MSMPKNIPDAASPEIVQNQNNAAQAWAFCYANNPDVNDLLHRGYSGGRWGRFTVVDVDHTFGTSVTTYVSADLSDGTLNFSTSSTNYNDTANFKTVETVVTDGTGITGVLDDRGGPGGVHGGAGGPGGPGGSTYPAVSPISGTSHNMVAADAGTYMRFTNASAKTLTVQNDATEALDDDTEYHGRNVGAADLTIVEDTSVTVNPPAGGSLVVPQGGTFTLKRVDVDEFDLFGVTSP